jgi:hypothetical protein
MRASYRPAIAGVAAMVLVASSMGCGNVTELGKSPALVVVDLIEAASGAEPGNMGGFLLSDVETVVDGNPSIFNDVARVTMHIIAKDVGTGQNALAPTPWNAVTLNRYRITFIRADGRNTPGVDVPHPVDGALTATITQTPSVVPFEIVRHQQKLEPPLISLARFGGRVFISTIAEITFYGADQVGNAVQTKATINVSFADYADPG